MKIAVFSTKEYDRDFLCSANNDHELTFFDTRLSAKTAILADGFPVICVFVNDELNAAVLQQLARQGTRLITLRCAGFNNVDLQAANIHGISVARVPSYSPQAVAEHAVALMLALNRNIHHAYNRVRDGNFSLQGLLGFDMGTRCVGIIGTGKIGSVVARILNGFGCQVIAYDPKPCPECEAIGVRYVTLPELYQQADIITLHCPLNPATEHLINREALTLMRQGVMLINTSRGAVIDTDAVVAALKSQQIAYLGLDVYEQEGDLFFKDLSNQIIQDDVFERLLTFPNVLITGHQGFFTHEAMSNIAQTTMANINFFAAGQVSGNEIGTNLIKTDT